MVAKIFEVPPWPVWEAIKAYQLALLLDALDYADSDYVAGWSRIMGLGAATHFSAADGWPLPFAVIYSNDGTVIALNGLRNTQQGVEFYANASLAPYYLVPGRINQMGRMAHEAVFTEIEKAIADAPNKTKFVVCGHSAGGVLASIIATKLRNDYGNSTVQYVYTYGTPKPGNAAFAANLSIRYYANENVGDPIPAFPWFTTQYGPLPLIPIGLTTPVNIGEPVAIFANGDVRHSRPWLRDPATPILLAQFVTNPSGGLGEAHQIAEYVRRLGLAARDAITTQEDSREVGMMDDMYGTVNAQVRMDDKTVSVTPPVRTRITDPAFPTIPQVQTTPVDNGNPTNPPPLAPPDPSLINVSQRVYAESIRSRSFRPPKRHFWKGDDRRLIERYLYILRQLLNRDLLLPKAGKTARISSVQPFFSEADFQLESDAFEVEGYFAALLEQDA